MSNERSSDTTKTAVSSEGSCLTVWRSAAAGLATLEGVSRRSGVTIVVKVDGERPDSIYTVIVSGEKLGDRFFRKDADDILQLLNEATDFCKKTIL